MYTPIRLFGKVAAILGPVGTFGLNIENRHYQDFLAWREKLPPEEKAKYDLSDQPPEPPTVDQDIERIKTILLKSDADITAGELKELVLKFVRKRI